MPDTSDKEKMDKTNNRDDEIMYKRAFPHKHTGNTLFQCIAREQIKREKWKQDSYNGVGQRDIPSNPQSR